MKLTLLLIEDDPDDALLIVRELGRCGYVPDWERVDTAPTLIEALQRQTWDVITCDWVMPSFSAIEALKILQVRAAETPKIIVSGEIAEEAAVAAMRGGAHDFVSKHHLARLCPAVERELRETEVRRAHRQAEQALRESEDRYRDLVENSQDLICTHDLEGRILSVNPAPARALGYTPAELAAMTLADVLAPEAREEFPEYLAVLRRDGIARGLMSVQTRSGERRVWEYANTVRTEGVAAPIVRGMAHDVTDRLRAERLLRKSEEHFRALTQNAVDLVAILNPDGTIRYASPSHEKTSGFTVAELIGRRAFDFVHPDDLPRVQRRFTRGLAVPGATASAEYRFRRKDGSWAVVEAVAKSLIDDPMVRGILVNSRDISERARAAEALRTLAAQQAGILDALPANIALLDPHGSILAVNQAWKRFAQANVFSGENFALGDNYLAVCERARGQCADDARAAAEGIRAVLRGDVFEFSLEYACHSQQRRAWFRLMAVPLVTDGTGGAVVMHIDVTDRWLAEEAAGKLTEELEARVRERTAALDASVRELEAFSYSVSHDLRAPLRHIAGFSRALRDEYGMALPAAAGAHLDRIESAAKRMEGLIQDLLGLSRVTLAPMHASVVDLSALAQAIADELRGNDPRRVEFVIAPCVVAYGDPPLLRVALENLLGNAWKYTAKHATARIEFGAATDDGRVCYFVRDDGAGFDMHDAAKLFAPFQRLHAAQDFDGTGIGLATVQRIIHRHGGRIWAEAAVERGATFFFELSGTVP